MIERQEAMVCPACGPGIGLLAPGAGLSKACWRARLEWQGGALWRWQWGCGFRVATCGGCGLQTARQDGARFRCSACGWSRERRPEDDAADAHLARVMAGHEPRAETPVTAPEPPREEQAAFAFVPPPMPTFRRGAQMPAPAKPIGYKPPRQKGR